MRLHTLGSTDLPVSPIGLGLAALGRPGYINIGHADDLDQTYEMAAMEAHTHDVLDAAYEAGVRYFDAARSYGRAEQFLRSWLRSCCSNARPRWKRTNSLASPLPQQMIAS